MADIHVRDAKRMSFFVVVSGASTRTLNGGTSAQNCKEAKRDLCKNIDPIRQDPTQTVGRPDPCATLCHAVVGYRLWQLIRFKLFVDANRQQRDQTGLRCIRNNNDAVTSRSPQTLFSRSKQLRDSTSRSTFCDGAFSVAGRREWNNLPCGNRER